MNNDFQRASELLKAHDNILILTHRRPDGDTSGSAGALLRALRLIGKTTYILKNPDVTKRYEELIDFCPPDSFEPSFIVAVDVADIGLLSENAMGYKDKIDLAIDHHKSHGVYAKTTVLEEKFAACGEVICEILLAMDIEIKDEIAKCIYIAISTDTGCFRYSNTTEHTHKVAAICLQSGLDGGEINRKIFETKSIARFHIERVLFDKMKFYKEGKIAIVDILRSDLDKTGADADDLDAIAALPRQIEGVEIGITLTENKDKTVKVSVRTAKDIDASEFCSSFGGGGHARAAGATMTHGIRKSHSLLLVAAEAYYA